MRPWMKTYLNAEQKDDEAKMDKIKEAEELSTGIVEEYLELLKPFVQQIERLNTRIKELEKEHKTDLEVKYIRGRADQMLMDVEVVQELQAKIKELETALDITAGALEGSQGVVKELEEELRRIRLGLGDDHGDDPVIVINALKVRVKELKGKVEKRNKQGPPRP